MQSDSTAQSKNFTTAGIVVPSTGGPCFPNSTITAEDMLQWVAHVAPRDVALRFDAAIEAAMKRTDHEYDRGNLCGVMQQCVDIMTLANASGF